MMFKLFKALISLMLLTPVTVFASEYCLLSEMPSGVVSTGYSYSSTCFTGVHWNSTSPTNNLAICGTNAGYGAVPTGYVVTAKTRSAACSPGGSIDNPGKYTIALPKDLMWICDNNAPAGYQVIASKEDLAYPCGAPSIGIPHVYVYQIKSNTGTGTGTGTGTSSSSSQNLPTPYPVKPEPVYSAIMNSYYGKCVHPSGGSANPGEGTPAVMWGGCGEERLKYSLPSSSEQSNFIRHVTSNKCLRPEGDPMNPVEGARILFSSYCDEGAKFTFKIPGSDLYHNNRIYHAASGMCLNVDGSTDGSFIVLTRSCAGGAGSYQFSKVSTRGQLLLQKSSGKCLRPENDGVTPIFNNKLIFTNDCDLGKPEHRFEMISGHLRHVSSGWCVHPQGGAENPSNGTSLVLHPRCDSSAPRFDRGRSGYNIEHVNSGMCVHPLGGSTNPTNGTVAIVYNLCDRTQDRLNFLYQYFGSSQLK